MTHDTSAADRQPETSQPETSGPGPAYAAPAEPPAQPPCQPSAPAQPGPAGYAPPPAGYGAQPGPHAQPGLSTQAPQVLPAPAAYASQPQQPQEHYWTESGLASVPALPPERVGRGALLALLAVPVGVVVSAVIWKIGFVASITGFLVAAVAAVLYVRGSGGRVKKGIPVIALVVALGVVASFFAAVAVDLYDVFPTLDPALAATYPTRGSFVSHNLFYGPVLQQYTKEIWLFALFGVLGAFGTILRLVRTNRTLGG